MGKKTKKDKNDIRLNLDLQMNLAGEIASRNPRIKALHEKYYNKPFKEYQKEYHRLLKEIHGEVFPWFPFPVLRLEEFEKSPNELVLRIDLNYTKDEILLIVEKYVAIELKEYRKNYAVKHKRKKPTRWSEYLEIWDLRSGDPPWIGVGSTKMPFGKRGKRRRRWTCEEIAKHLYPDQQTPEELKAAIDRVKNKYRAAYKLICGKKYNPEEIENRKAHIRTKSKGQDLCDQCTDQHCKETGEICPSVLEDLERFDKKQQDLLVPNLQRLDIEKYKVKSRKYPTADEQFK